MGSEIFKYHLRTEPHYDLFGTISTNLVQEQGPCPGFCSLIPLPLAASSMMNHSHDKAITQYKIEILLNVIARKLRTAWCNIVACDLN